MIDLRIKKLFFDRAAVMGAVDRGTRKVLSRFGAFVRTTARNSIRKRKAVSAPGSPPSGHVGTLKRLIFFGYDPVPKSVVIGPTPLHSRSDAAPLLEYGGRTRRRDWRGKVKAANYRARPFMGPAMEKEMPKLPAMWRDSIWS